MKDILKVVAWVVGVPIGLFLFGVVFAVAVVIAVSGAKFTMDLFSL